MSEFDPDDFQKRSGVQPSAEEAAARRAQEGVVTPEERARRILDVVDLSNPGCHRRLTWKISDAIREADKAAYERGLQQGAAEERERAAEIAETLKTITVQGEWHPTIHGEKIAAAIRARGESDDG